MYFICVTVQGYYTNCTMEMCQMYKTLNRFVRFLNNLGLTLRRLSIVFFFFYQTMSLILSLQKLTHRK